MFKILNLSDSLKWPLSRITDSESTCKANLRSGIALLKTPKEIGYKRLSVCRRLKMFRDLPTHRR